MSYNTLILFHLASEPGCGSAWLPIIETRRRVSFW
jgi:hypothetical protein